MKNIVFDLGGVVFMRDMKKCTQEFIDFFSFVRGEVMPRFWNEYDRGTLTKEQTIECLMERSGYDRTKCAALVDEAIAKQEAVKPTEKLIEELKAAGYHLFVLSNMSREFIDFLRRIPVYRHFEGEVVSCEEGFCKPEPEIYRLLLSRYALDPSETLFIDDRRENVEAAEREGIHGFLFDRTDLTAICNRLRQLLLP